MPGARVGVGVGVAAGVVAGKQHTLSNPRTSSYPVSHVLGHPKRDLLAPPVSLSHGGRKTPPP